MSEWRCQICNYRATGDAAPERCPVCGVDRSKFVLVAADDDSPARPAPAVPAADAGFAPVPGAAPVTPPPPPAPPPAPMASPRASADRPVGAPDLWSFLKRQMVRNRAHPISAHVPNGVLPAAVVLLFLGLVFGNLGFQKAAFYNLVIVVIAMPVVMFAGYLDWKARYGGVYTSIIVTKIACGVVVFVVGLVLVLWGSFTEGPTWAFFLLQLIMLGAAGIAGFMGGKLVFGNGGDEK